MFLCTLTAGELYFDLSLVPAFAWFKSVTTKGLVNQQAQAVVVAVPAGGGFVARGAAPAFGAVPAGGGFAAVPAGGEFAAAAPEFVEEEEKRKYTGPMIGLGAAVGYRWTLKNQWFIAMTLFGADFSANWLKVKGSGGNVNIALPTQLKIGKHLSDRFSVYGVVNPFAVTFGEIEGKDVLGAGLALGAGFLLRMSAQWSFFTEVQFKHDYPSFFIFEKPEVSFMRKSAQIKALVGFQLGRK